LLWPSLTIMWPSLFVAVIAVAVIDHHVAVVVCGRHLPSCGRPLRGDRATGRIPFQTEGNFYNVDVRLCKLRQMRCRNLGTEVAVAAAVMSTKRPIEAAHCVQCRCDKYEQ